MGGLGISEVPPGLGAVVVAENPVTSTTSLTKIKMLYAPCGRAVGLAKCLPQCVTVVWKKVFEFFFQFSSKLCFISGFFPVFKFRVRNRT